MHTHDKKPKLLYFCPPMDNVHPYRLKGHFNSIYGILENDFDCKLVSYGSSLAEELEAFPADICLFDMAVYGEVDKARAEDFMARDIDARRDVPRIVLMKHDADSAIKKLSVAVGEQIGADAYFSVDTSMREFLPDLADKTFILPWAVDTDTFQDYGEPKTVQVAMLGFGFIPSRDAWLHYPWRLLCAQNIINRYQVLLSSRPQVSPFISYDEAFARNLNMSLLGLSCGGVVNRLVRKHLEIPASKACLVTEDTPVMRAAGFEDMVNCVFATPDNVTEKIDHLLRNPEKLAEITARGYALAREKHSMRARHQVFQWLSLRKSLKPGEKIIQPDIFGEMLVIPEGKIDASTEEKPKCLLTRVCLSGDNLLRGGHCAFAKNVYRKSLRFSGEFIEAQLRVALCDLLEGKAKAAHDALHGLHASSVDRCGRPDPAEHAWLLFATLCKGRREDAARLASEFSWMTHPLLERTRRLAEEAGELTPCRPCLAVRPAASVYSSPFKTLGDEAAFLVSALKACGRTKMAETAGAFYARAGLSSRSQAEKFPDEEVENLLSLVRPSSGRNIIFHSSFSLCAKALLFILLNKMEWLLHSFVLGKKSPVMSLLHRLKNKLKD